MTSTINELIARQAKQYGSKTFLYYKDQEITYAEFDKISNAFAHEMLANDIKKGDRVAIALPNCPEFLYAFFGIMKAGAVAVPINIAFKPPEMEHILTNSGASGLIIGSMFGDLGKQFYAKGGALRWFKTLQEGKPKEAALAALNGFPLTPASAQSVPEDPASLIYTSGTTGFPKGAVLTHKNYLSNVAQFTPGLVTEGDRFLCILPLFHVNAQVVTTLAPLYVGGSMILLERFTPKEFFPALANFKATAFSAVPSLYAVLLNLPDSEKYDLSSLRFCICGAAPMPVPVFEAFEKKFKAKILEGYGLSEGTCVSSVNPWDGTRKIGSIGLPIKGQPMKIIANDGQELPDGQTGEIVMQGDNVMKGYFNNPQATAETLINGWLHTGDLGYKDKDGYFFIAGRKKEMIIRAGENIYPKEIEEILYKHPAIAEAAVIGLPDERWGEEVAAFIVLKEGQQSTQKDIVSYCRQSLADYKCPRKIEFVPTLPKTATGKIQKVKIKEDYIKANNLKTQHPARVS
ncbi:MAG: long-chain fatty acid--CoA ligase [Elusimicrobia bacterium]|nr:long-chain fatty acid--CoA ligase [Elusimicrobiota bacterium]